MDAKDLGHLPLEEFSVNPALPKAITQCFQFVRAERRLGLGYPDCMMAKRHGTILAHSEEHEGGHS